MFEDTECRTLTPLLFFSCNKGRDSSQRAGHLPSAKGPLSEAEFYPVPECLSSLAGRGGPTQPGQLSTEGFFAVLFIWGDLFTSRVESWATFPADFSGNSFRRACLKRCSVLSLYESRSVPPQGGCCPLFQRPPGSGEVGSMAPVEV